MQVAEAVGETGGQQLVQLAAFLVAEARRAAVGAGVLQVDVLVCNVEVAAEDDGFNWAGVPKIEVTFDLDANGIVKVSARDMDTGKEQGITITGSSNLSEDEIQKAMRNAAAFAGQDQERKAALEAFNAAEAALYRVNTALGSKAGKALDRDTRSKIKDAVRALEKELRHKKADKLTTADVQSLNAAREALSAIATPLVTQWESEKG